MSSEARIVAPPGPLNAIVRVPGSKSVANRALVCAFLAEGTSTVTGIPDGDDTAVIIDALSQVGRIAGAGDTWVVKGSRSVVLPGIIDAQLAGTSSRFLTAVAALVNSTTVIDGGEPLRSRPMADLHEALSSLGAAVEPLGEPGHLPVSVSRAQLRGGNLAIRGDVSSQFISAVMLIAPLLAGGLTISIEGELVSRSYVEMTASVMQAFGVRVDIADNTVRIAEGAYTPTDYFVEPDFSSAAFPLVAPVLRVGSVVVPGLAKSVMQGDAALLEILRRVGCHVEMRGDDVLVMRSEVDQLFPVSLQMADCSDLVPAVAVALSAIPGESRIEGVGFIRNKESDRLGDLATEMRVCGADVEVTDDGLVIRGHSSVHTSAVQTHHDHRLAMALSLYGLVNDEVIVLEPDVVSKSWPSYFLDMHVILGTPEVEK